MTDFPSDGGLSAVSQQTGEAAAALASLKAPADAAADAIDQAFTRAGTSLAKTLAKAASDGKLSLGELATAVIEAVDAAAGKGAGGGLAGALGALLGSVFTGARADGGPVSPGGAYLVGERGPEVFRPPGAGSVEPLGAPAAGRPAVAAAPVGDAYAPAAGPRFGEAPASPSVTVNLNLPAGTDAPALMRSEAQVAQALARAVALGRR